MKIKLFFLVLVSIFIISCKDSDVENTSVIGKWSWVSSTGGIAGLTETPESTGKVCIVEFTRDSIYKSYENGILTSQRSFHVIKNIDDFTEYPYIMKYDNNDFGFHFVVENNQLVFNDTFADGVMSVYKRIK